MSRSCACGSRGRGRRRSVRAGACPRLRRTRSGWPGGGGGPPGAAPRTAEPRCRRAWDGSRAAERWMVSPSGMRPSRGTCQGVCVPCGPWTNSSETPLPGSRPSRPCRPPGVRGPRPGREGPLAPRPGRLRPGGNQGAARSPDDLVLPAPAGWRPAPRGPRRSRLPLRPHSQGSGAWSVHLLRHPTRPCSRRGSTTWSSRSSPATPSPRRRCRKWITSRRSSDVGGTWRWSTRPERPTLRARPARSVSQVAGSPVRYPVRNQRWRCSAEPWVQRLGVRPGRWPPPGCGRRRSPRRRRGRRRCRPRSAPR